MFDGFLNSISDRLAAEAVFLAGAIGIFGAVAARLLLIVPPLSHRSGRLAFFHSLPVASAAIVMTLMNQPELAFKVVLGSSVALMSGVAGFILISSEEVDPDPAKKNIWIFAFVPALLLFLMGLRDSLDEIDALILLTLGALILTSWKPSQPDQNLMNLPPARPFRLALSAGALGLCCVGALLAVHGGVALQNLDRNFSLVSMGPTLLCIALCYPLIGPGLRLAHEKKTSVALDAILGSFFINVALVLPILILVYKYPIQISTNGTSHALTITRLASGLPFPRSAWRIDSLALLILALPYLPAAESRLKFTIGMAFFLILIQAICFFSNLTLLGL